MSGNTGMDVCHLEIEASQSDFGGYRETIDVADATVGITSGTAPTNNIFLLCGFFNPQGSGATLGTAWMFTLDVELDFFELYSPAT